MKLSKYLFFVLFFTLVCIFFYFLYQQSLKIYRTDNSQDCVKKIFLKKYLILKFIITAKINYNIMNLVYIIQFQSDHSFRSLHNIKRYSKSKIIFINFFYTLYILYIDVISNCIIILLF